MKKQYIQPALEVVKMKYSTQLMAEIWELAVAL